jgi:hypothetical protein
MVFHLAPLTIMALVANISPNSTTPRWNLRQSQAPDNCQFGQVLQETSNQRAMALGFLDGSLEAESEGVPYVRSAASSCVRGDGRISKVSLSLSQQVKLSRAFTTLTKLGF